MTFNKFVCPTCSKNIDTLGKLNKHLKTHTKPYICETCNKGFALRVDLGRHIKSRHRTGNEQYRCHVERCSFTSDRKDNLERHRKKQHRTGLLHTPVKICDETRIDVSANAPLYSKANLMRVATSGDVAMLKIFLDSGMSFDTKADDQSTALHCAARAGQATAVEYLLMRGASVDLRNDKKRLPIHEAILSERCDAVQPFLEFVTQKVLLDMAQELESYMIQSGTITIVDVYIRRLGDYFRDQETSKKLRFAVRTGHGLLAATLLSDPGVDVNMLYGGKHGLVHSAALLGRKSVMEVLIACDRVDKTLKTNSSRQALHVAASKGHTAIVEQLVRHPSVDVNCLTDDGETPLHYASSAGRTMVVQQLIGQPSVDVNCRDKNKATPLHHAVCNWNWEIASMLLRYSDSMSDGHRIPSDVPPTSPSFTKEDLFHRLFKYPDFGGPNKLLPGGHTTILYVAAKKGDCEVIDILLACPDIDVNIRGQGGRTPLMTAAQHGKLEAVKLLLQHKNIDVNQTDEPRHPWTALKYAKDWKCDDIVNLLLSHGAIDYSAEAPSFAPTTAHIDNSQNTTLQPDHETHFDPFVDDMDDAPTEAWEEFPVMEKGVAERTLFSFNNIYR